MPDLNLDIKDIISRVQRHQPTRLQHLLKNVDDAPRITTAPLNIRNCRVPKATSVTIAMSNVF